MSDHSLPLHTLAPRRRHTGDFHKVKFVCGCFARSALLLAPSVRGTYRRFSDLSSRRHQESERGGTANEASNTAAGRSNRNAAPVSNPASETNTPVGTLRDLDPNSAIRPRPSSRPPPQSELTVSGESGGDPSSVVYLNFEHESEDGLSNLSSPRTLLREQAVARVTVENRNTTGNNPETTSNAASHNQPQTRNNTNSGTNVARLIENLQGSANAREQSTTSPEEQRSGAANDSAEQTRARVRRNREGITLDNSENSNRPTRIENDSERRVTTPAPVYTLEQPSRSRRNRQESAPEPPPPYQTHDPNRRPSRDELEAQSYLRAQAQAQAQFQAQIHAHMHAQPQLFVRQHSRNRGEYDPTMGGASTFYAAATYM